MDDVKKIQQAKMKRVEISYGYENNEWEEIEIEFTSGEHAIVTRRAVEAFLRVNKVLEDLQQVQALRDGLVKIFGATAPFVPSSP